LAHKKELEEEVEKLRTIKAQKEENDARLESLGQEVRFIL
jgi:hypothetical protein